MEGKERSSELVSIIDTFKQKYSQLRELNVALSEVRLKLFNIKNELWIDNNDLTKGVKCVSEDDIEKEGEFSGKLVSLKDISVDLQDELDSYSNIINSLNYVVSELNKLI